MRTRQFHICECGEHSFVALTKGFVALCDTNMVPALAGSPWKATTVRKWHRVYAFRNVRRDEAQSTEVMHRLVLVTDKNVDHINGNGLDNRRSNLRPCTNQQNQYNARSRRGRSRFKGVSPTKTGRWKAYIQPNRKFIQLGTFDHEEQAAAAYDAAAIRHFGEYAALNFPQGAQ